MAKTPEKSPRKPTQAIPANPAKFGKKESPMRERMAADLKKNQHASEKKPG